MFNNLPLRFFSRSVKLLPASPSAARQHLTDQRNDRLYLEHDQGELEFDRSASELHSRCLFVPFCGEDEELLMCIAVFVAKRARD